MIKLIKGNERRPRSEHTPRASQSPLPGNPLILSREEHSISRRDIDPDAIKIMYRLLQYGYRAFLVGGGVRDLLLGKAPKDFDIGTDARPEQVRSLFRNSRIIGRRFRLNHIFFHGGKNIEVSTFRATQVTGQEEEASLLLADNTYGDAESDALRRDLTINGLFYDLSTFSVIDYVGGIKDLQDKVIRVIGDPVTRFQEDPVRMIRAVRHAARAGFRIEPETFQGIYQCRPLIRLCPPARVFEEFLREMRQGSALRSFQLLDEVRLLEYLMPVLAQALLRDRKRVWSHLQSTLKRIDQYVAEGRELPSSVLFPALLIGNFPFNKEDREEPESTRALARLYWDASLDNDAIAKIFDGINQQEESVPEKVGPKSRRGRARKSKLPLLRRSINELFLSVGVPRKEREDMEDILLLRFRLLFEFEREHPDTSLIKRRLFPPALMLVYLSAHDTRSEACYEYWNNAANQGSESVADEEKTVSIRKRRGRRRRRRPSGKAP